MAQIVSYLQVLTVDPWQDRVRWVDLNLVLVHRNLMDLAPADPVCQTLLQTVVLLVIFEVNLHLDVPGHPGLPFPLVQDLTAPVVLTVHLIVVHQGLMDLTNFLDQDHLGHIILARTVQDLAHPTDQWAHTDLCMAHPPILWTDGRCPCCSPTTRSSR